MKARLASSVPMLTVLRPDGSLLTPGAGPMSLATIVPLADRETSSTPEL